MEKFQPRISIFIYKKTNISIIVEVKTHLSLPEHLCFDKIKSTKDSKNGMSFVFLDARTHDFIDIVDGRTQHILKQYFMRYPRKVKKKVKNNLYRYLPTLYDYDKRNVS